MALEMYGSSETKTTSEAVGGEAAGLDGMTDTAKTMNSYGNAVTTASNGYTPTTSAAESAGSASQKSNATGSSGTGGIESDSKVQQNVKYDTNTGKMYEELGGGSTSGADMTSGSGSTGNTGGVTTASATDYYSNYQTYPYASMGGYMSGFASTGYGSSTTSSTTGNHLTTGSAAVTSGMSGTATSYDRSMYNPYNSPGAFVPPINLSVKTPGDAGLAASGGLQTQPSLDLTMGDGTSASTTSLAAAAAASYLNPQDFATSGGVGQSTSSQGTRSTAPQILDLTRPGGLLG